ncbi:MAG: IPT/TIG domain-containing protein [Acidobacteriota bacterium]|nr:IPT/TIG domain-containing protein [Acidobacteriota bacterium]
MAVSQVDVVAHSFGGMLIRGRVAASSYYRLDNYQRGDFHKIIYIGVPHDGSPLADFVVEHECHPVRDPYIGVFGTDTLGQFMDKRNMHVRPVHDFTTWNPVRKRLGSTRVPSHVIATLAPADCLTKDNINNLLQAVASSVSIDDVLDDAFNRRGEHDLIVTLSSSISAISSKKAQNIIPGVVHYFNQNDASQATSPHVRERIEELLNLPVDSEEFGWLPTPLVYGRPRTCIPPALKIPRQTTALRSPRVDAQPLISLTPNPGQVVQPGVPFAITFSIVGGRPVKGASFDIGNDHVAIEGSGPFTVNYIAPKERAGAVEIFAATYGGQGENYSAKSHVVVRPSSPIKKLTVPTEYLLLEEAKNVQLTVTGVLTDGTQIDVTSGAAGTIYSLQSKGTSVISVSPNGLVEVRGAGEDTIFIANSGVTVTIPVIVRLGNLAPTITSLVPSTVIAGEGPLTLMITGQNFLSDVTISLGNRQRKANFVSPSQLKVELLSVDTTETDGTLNVWVANPKPGGGVASASLKVVDLGTSFSQSSPSSNQKSGSVLVYNFYASGASNQTTENTRISITNIHQGRAIAVHLFFVDGSNCSVADAIVCLTPNQTTSFLASDLDPGTSGYLIAVAVDTQTGCPSNFNFLIGDEYIKLDSGHAANLGAEAFAAVGLNSSFCDATSTTAVLKFDGISYNEMPRVLALNNILSRSDGNDTLLVVNRIGGNLATGASTIGSLSGVLYGDVENGFSFTTTVGACQLRALLMNSFPRTTPRFEQVILAGRSGWMKFWGASDVGLLGATINLNKNSAANASAFNQGHNLHKLTLTNVAVLTIPIFPPNCQ